MTKAAGPEMDSAALAPVIQTGSVLQAESGSVGATEFFPRSRVAVPTPAPQAVMDTPLP